MITPSYLSNTTMVLRFLLIALFAISQSHGYENPEEVKQVLTKILEEQLNEIKIAHEGIEDILKKIKEDNAKEKHNESLLELEDVPMPCMSLAKATNARCPDAAELIKQITVVMDKTAKLVLDGIHSFNAAFSSEGSKCTSTINPITALRCFLRAFRIAYDGLSTIKAEALDLKSEVLKLYDEYNEYRTDCKEPDTHIQLKTQIFELCKKVHSRK